MHLPFLDRREEIRRLRGLLARRQGSLAVLYGRRRCGKSRLIREALARKPAVYYVADDREPSLQRAALAAEVGRAIPGFADVTYPDWEALLTRQALESALADLDKTIELDPKYVDVGIPVLVKASRRSIPSRCDSE